MLSSRRGGQPMHKKYAITDLSSEILMILAQPCTALQIYLSICSDNIGGVSIHMIDHIRLVIRYLLMFV